MEIARRRPFGWSKAFRLRKHAQYSRVQSKGRRVGGKFVLLIFAPSSILGVRFGITVSRHVGKAVVRNRVKRRLREILRRLRPSVEGCSLDMVWIARAEAARADYSALQSDVTALLERVQRGRTCSR